MLRQRSGAQTFLSVCGWHVFAGGRVKQIRSLALRSRRKRVGSPEISICYAPALAQTGMSVLHYARAQFNDASKTPEPLTPSSPSH